MIMSLLVARFMVPARKSGWIEIKEYFAVYGEQTFPLVRAGG